MTRSAILILTGLLIAGCTRSTPAPVIYGQTQSYQAAQTRAAPARTRATQTRAAYAAVPLPEVKPRSIASRPSAAPLARVAVLRPVQRHQQFAFRPTRTGTTVAVRPGDTVNSLARRYDVSVRDLIDENRLSPPFRLVIGQRLVIPASRRHVVAAHETVYSIAHHYGVDMRALVRSNGLSHPFRLRIGQVLWIPGAGPAEPAPSVRVAQSSQSTQPTQPVQSARSAWPAHKTKSMTFASIAKKIRASAPSPQPRPTTQRAAETKVASLAPVATPAPEQEIRPAPPKPKSVPLPLPTARKDDGPQFSWPTRGRVISRYGAKRGGLHNDGINIAVAKGAPVRAASDGVVIYAGNEVRGFGNLVLVRHSGGWTTAYAHNDAVLVRRGDTVRRGDLLARAGSSGSVKRTQLHFEIRRGTEALDPLHFLAHGGARRTG